jgi:hypothetical protein
MRPHKERLAGGKLGSGFDLVTLRAPIPALAAEIRTLPLARGNQMLRAPARSSRAFATARDAPAAGFHAELVSKLAADLELAELVANRFRHKLQNRC